MEKSPSSREFKVSGMTRRDFLEIFMISTVILGGLPTHTQAETGQGKRYSKLVDTTKCIGCKRCMSACKRWNKLKVDRPEDLTDRETTLSGHSWVVVNLRRDERNSENLTYVHWACQHCGKPACAGVCPVSAIKKYPEGPVVVNPDKCIGCRYCYQACPYKIPRFDFEKRVTRKCTLCYDRIPRIKPACVAACPVQALDFGPREEMLEKAKAKVEAIKGYLLGEKEAGGTDVLTILPAPPERFGLIVAPPKVVNQDFDKLRITASGLSAASLVIAALYLYAGLSKDDK